jgi:hypothetical protein
MKSCRGNNHLKDGYYISYLKCGYTLWKIIKTMPHFAMLSYLATTILETVLLAHHW